MGHRFFIGLLSCSLVLSSLPNTVEAGGGSWGRVFSRILRPKKHRDPTPDTGIDRNIEHQARWHALEIARDRSRRVLNPFAHDGVLRRRGGAVRYGLRTGISTAAGGLLTAGAGMLLGFAPIVGAPIGAGLAALWFGARKKDAGFAHGASGIFNADKAFHRAEYAGMRGGLFHTPMSLVHSASGVVRSTAQGLSVGALTGAALGLLASPFLGPGGVALGIQVGLALGGGAGGLWGGKRGIGKALATRKQVRWQREKRGQEIDAELAGLEKALKDYDLQTKGLKKGVANRGVLRNLMMTLEAMQRMPGRYLWRQGAAGGNGESRKRWAKNLLRRAKELVDIPTATEIVGGGVGDQKIHDAAEKSTETDPSRPTDDHREESDTGDGPAEESTISIMDPKTGELIDVDLRKLTKEQKAALAEMAKTRKEVELTDPQTGKKKVALLNDAELAQLKQKMGADQGSDPTRPSHTDQSTQSTDPTRPTSEDDEDDNGSTDDSSGRGQGQEMIAITDPSTGKHYAATREQFEALNKAQQEGKDVGPLLDQLHELSDEEVKQLEQEQGS